jgi:hypothetical protein
LANASSTLYSLLTLHHLRKTAMTIERMIRIIAGLFIMISLALGVEGSPLFVSKWALAFTAFVGANLFQFGFTNFCPMAIILRKLGFKDGAACSA